MMRRHPSSCSGPPPRPAAAPRPGREAWSPRAVRRWSPTSTPQPGLVVLESPGLEVLAALSASGAERAVLLGSGYGAMVALHVAANYPERVAALVLSTASRSSTASAAASPTPRTACSPVSRVQQLHGPQGRVLELLDQVRTVDWTPFADRVRTPALVVLGERDAVNRGPSRRLAAVLPSRAARRPRREGGLGRARPVGARDRRGPVPGAPRPEPGRRPAITSPGAVRSTSARSLALQPERGRGTERTSDSGPRGPSGRAGQRGAALPLCAVPSVDRERRTPAARCSRVNSSASCSSASRRAREPLLRELTSSTTWPAKPFSATQDRVSPARWSP